MPYTATTRVLRVNPEQPDSEMIQQAAEKLREGGLVAFPTETVYGLGANALDAEAVNRIYSAKRRPASDPIILHIYDRLQLGQIAVNIPALAYQLADKFWPGPLTLVLRRHQRVPSNVSAGLDTVAVRMPNHPIALALLRTAQLPVAAPSANRFARPSATTAQHVLEDLDGHVDIILDGGAAVIGLESTIVNLTKDPPQVLRPGGISLEALRTLIPAVTLVSKQLRPEDKDIESPGMLIKHYSPRAKVLLFSGVLERVIPAMQKRTQALLQAGHNIGILIPEDERTHFEQFPVQVFALGTGLSEISHNLFTGMRELDKAHVDVILVHDFEQKGLGTALWDRLLRAAEGEVIQC